MNYRFPRIPVVNSEAEAQDVAIAWQNWQSTQSLSIGELSDWQAYFEGLVEKFPDLRDEFVENCII